MRTGILGEDRVQVGKRRIVVFILFVSQSALSQGRRHLGVIWKGLHVIRESFDNVRNVFRLHMTQAKFVCRFGAQLWRKLRGAQFPIN